MSHAPVPPPAHARGYADPIKAGVVLGLILLAAILIAGQGLGASGAFAVGASAAANTVVPHQTEAQPYLASWIPTGRGGFFGDWIVLEIVGVMLGAWASARLAGRIHRGVTHLRTETTRQSLAAALVGGGLMGGGARLAHGCTSGLALTGGALLATGAWIFIPVTFASAFAVAFLMRRGSGT